VDLVIVATRTDDGIGTERAARRQGGYRRVIRLGAVAAGDRLTDILREAANGLVVVLAGTRPPLAADMGVVEAAPVKAASGTFAAAADIAAIAADAVVGVSATAAGVDATAKAGGDAAPAGAAAAPAATGTAATAAVWLPPESIRPLHAWEAAVLNRLPVPEWLPQILAELLAVAAPAYPSLSRGTPAVHPELALVSNPPPPPAVTIVTCTYNDHKPLPWAVYSVVRQTCPSWELLLVDDGSPGGFPAELALPDDRRIRRLNLWPNRGKAEALQSALAHARGEWLLELDPDDWLDPAALAILLSAAGRSAVFPAALALTGESPLCNSHTGKQAPSQAAEAPAPRVGVISLLASAVAKPLGGQRESTPQAVIAGHCLWRQNRDGSGHWRPTGLVRPLLPSDWRALLRGAQTIAPRLYRTCLLRRHGGWLTLPGDPGGGRLYEDIQLLARLIHAEEPLAVLLLPLYHRRLRAGSVSRRHLSLYPVWRDWFTCYLERQSPHSAE
jgi:glycosyltransferase involved in cell wall biosynthesis